MLTPVSGGADLTASFLTRALAGQLDGGVVSAVVAEPVGTGQVSDSFRLRLRYNGSTRLPPTMVAKVPAAAEASRGAARTFRTYEIEASFYGQVAAGLAVCIPRCFYAAYDPEPDEYIVLLEDLAPAEPGDQLTGISPDQAAAAIQELAALHAAGWESEELAALPWLNRNTPDAATFLAGVLASLYPGFRDRFDGRVKAGTLSLIEDFLPRAPGYLERRRSAAAHARARRLPGRQPAVRRAPAGRARLADVQLRDRRQRPGLLPRFQPARARPAGA